MAKIATTIVGPPIPTVRPSVNFSSSVKPGELEGVEVGVLDPAEGSVAAVAFVQFINRKLRHD